VKRKFETVVSLDALEENVLGNNLKKCIIKMI